MNAMSGTPTGPVETCVRWVGPRTAPGGSVRRWTKLTTLDGVRWIIFGDERDGRPIIVEMAQNAPTKACSQDRHDQCSVRLPGAPGSWALDSGGFSELSMFGE